MKVILTVLMMHLIAFATSDVLRVMLTLICLGGIVTGIMFLHFPVFQKKALHTQAQDYMWDQIFKKYRDLGDDYSVYDFIIFLEEELDFEIKDENIDGYTAELNFRFTLLLSNTLSREGLQSLIEQHFIIPDLSKLIAA